MVVWRGKSNKIPVLGKRFWRERRSLVPNTHFNGHPDLVVRGRYPNNAVAEGADGVEIKSTRKEGGAVDTHGARNQWMCVFVYEVDTTTEPASERRPMQFTEVYLGQVVEDDFRSGVAPKRPDMLRFEIAS